MQFQTYCNPLDTRPLGEAHIAQERLAAKSRQFYRLIQRQLLILLCASFIGLTALLVQQHVANAAPLSTPIQTTAPITPVIIVPVPVINTPEPNPVWIGDYVWWDWNGDGLQNEATAFPGVNPGLGGVTVRLLNSAGEVISNTVTDAYGTYFFSGLTPGASYQIEVVPPAGYGFTRPNRCPNEPCIIIDGEPDDDSDIDPATGRSHVQALARGPVLTSAECFDCRNVDAGLIRLGAIGDYVWHDVNRDGRQNDGASAGLNGVEVRLLAMDNQVLTSTITTNDANGNPGYYHFGGLPEGQNYRIEFVLPVGYSFTTPHQECDPATIPCAVINESGEDSDADPATGRSQVVQIWPGPAYPGDTCVADCVKIDAGLVTNSATPVSKFTPTPSATPDAAATMTPTPIEITLPAPTATDVSACLITIDNNGLSAHQPVVTVQSNVADAAQMQLSNDSNFTNAVWQPYQQRVTWILPASSQPVAKVLVYAHFRDANNNLLCNGQSVSAGTVYDVQAPQIMMALDQSGQLYIQAEDQTGGSGITEVQISTNSDFADASWQAWQAVIPVNTLPGTTLYVRVRDGAGNVSAALTVTKAGIYLPLITR